MTVSTLAFAVALLGWAPLVVLLSWRLRRVESEIADLQAHLTVIAIHANGNTDSLMHHASDMRVLRQDLTQTAREAAKTADDLTDLRGEYLAQARALDAHDERLQALEDR
jgi:hypothetical protein